MMKKNTCIWHIVLSIAIGLGLCAGNRAFAANEYAEALRLAGESKFADAYKMLLPLAERGERKAQYIVGESLFWGNGVSQDQLGAVKWYRKAADAGLPEAKFNLAHAYKDGTGVAASRKQFELLLRSAADAGYDKAQQDYSVLLRERKDFKLALKWALRAASQGLVASQVNAGHLYRLGLGTQANEEEALFWLGMASPNYKPADQYARQLAQKLGPERTDAVIKRMAVWKPTRELAPITALDRK